MNSANNQKVKFLCLQSNEMFSFHLMSFHQALHELCNAMSKFTNLLNLCNGIDDGARLVFLFKNISE